MSRRALTNYAAAASVMLAFGAAPALAQAGTAADRDRTADTTRAADQARETTSSTGEKITDAWILAKVKAQFVGEDALEHSDIDVDVRDHVVYLKGAVISEAGRARAAEIAHATDGVTRVVNNLRIGPKSDAANRDHSGDATIAAREAGRDAEDAADSASEKTKSTARAAKDEAKETTKDVKESAREAGRDAGEAIGTTGEAVTDGWITTKVKSSFVGVDVLEGSSIDVDTKDHVVTLRGTVPSAAARAKAVSLAKQVDEVKSVKDEMTIGPKK